MAHGFVYLCTAIACLAPIMLGYDIGAMSGAIIFMERDLNLSSWDEELIISSLSFFCIVGALFGGQLAASYGRKKTIAISALLFFIGTIVMVVTRFLALIITGRIIIGIATGIGLVIAPLYTAELAPHQIRGRLVAFAEISINAGIVFGYLVAWAFYFVHNDSAAWRIMLAFGCIPAVVLFIGALFMPESPRWLIEHGHIEEAKQALMRIYEDTPSKVADQMLVSHQEEQPLTDIVDAKIKEIQQVITLEERTVKASWNEVLLPCVFSPGAVLQKALLVGCGVAFFQQASGIDAVVYYTPSTFRELGLNDQKVLLYTTYVGLCKLFYIFIAMLILDRVGRKPLLLISSILITLALLGLVLTFVIERNVGVTIFLQCLYVSAFSIGWGPCCWVMISEIFPLQIRSRAMAVATCINRFTAGMVALFFLSIQEAITPTGIWIVFAVFGALSTLFVFRFVPETKHKTLEQITNSLTYGVEDCTEDEAKILSADAETDNNVEVLM